MHEDKSGSLGIERVSFFLLVIVASSVITLASIAEDKWEILLVAWPAIHAIIWVGTWLGMRRSAGLVLLFFISMVYYAFLHVGILAALWRMKGWRLLLEGAMLAAVVGFFLVFRMRLASFLE